MHIASIPIPWFSLRICMSDCGTICMAILTVYSTTGTLFHIYNILFLLEKKNVTLEFIWFTG